MFYFTLSPPSPTLHNIIREVLGRGAAAALEPLHLLFETRVLLVLPVAIESDSEIRSSTYLCAENMSCFLVKLGRAGLEAPWPRRP
jgi:hypothetical protein